MNIEELKIKYKDLPQEIKNISRWICYSIEEDLDKPGEIKKIPRNAISGSFAKTNNPLTWTTFNAALLGCAKHNFAGLGFILGTDSRNGETYFGVDLDNHVNNVTHQKQMRDDDFEDLIDEFVNTLNSYSEYSHSGEGVHIICKGKLPVGARRKNGINVEMYDSVRFFTMSGKVILNSPIMNREQEIIPLWEKYLYTPENNNNNNNLPTPISQYGYKEEEGVISLGKGIKTQNLNKAILDDYELISVIRSSQDGADFMRLYNGDISQYNNDHSAADLALCLKLAFWTSCNMVQMDSIFRSSGLMREKWDQKRGNDTYGNLTLKKAVNAQVNTYTPSFSNKNKEETSQFKKKVSMVSEQAFDEFGNPVIVTHSLKDKYYSYTDTGNAERFYDQFGQIFKYNVTNNYWMYWDGRTWIVDSKMYIKKYADKLIEQLRNDAFSLNREIKELSTSENNEAQIKSLKEEQKQMLDNIKRLSNKAGKDAMLSELQHLNNVAVENKEFDTYPTLLNTHSGIVDLETGEIKPFDKKLMLAKNTHCEVSFEEAPVWEAFIRSIFEQNDLIDTEEIVNCIQKAIGYSLSSLTREQCLFMLVGSGSNGKSTFQEQIASILGDYAATTPSQTLMQSKNGGNNTQFSLAKLKGIRFVNAKETDEGEKMSEAQVKNITGADTISAAFKYGNEFDFKPEFKIWLSTNNKPYIKGTDEGIWRRIFLFEFFRKFTKENKDLDLPEKLKKETPQILGWAIKGYLLYKKEGLLKPRCVEEAIANYRGEMDYVESYLREQTNSVKGHRTKANSIYEDYIRWTDEGKYNAMNRNKFFTRLNEKGYVKERRKDGYYYKDICLNSDTSIIALGKGSQFER